jgi:hypothetical protein
MDDDPKTRLRENATEVATTVVTGFWIAALVTGQSWWLGALLLSYIVVVPLVALLFGDEDDQREWWDDDWWGSPDEWWGESSSDDDADKTVDAPTSANNRDALETLRNRYAEGELTDEQFERKLERLLETETLEDVEHWRSAARKTRDDRERNRDREFEYET